MRIYIYKIPIVSSLLPFIERQGLIFESERGIGEAAPLPGWSPESLQDLVNCTNSLFAYPSCVFGLRCAELAFPTAFPSISVAGLATNLTEAQQRSYEGFQTVKIKIKDYSVPDALDFVCQAQKLNLRLRIDINRSWSFNQARYFMSQLDPTSIEYIEEPIDDLDQLSHLPDLPIALDETLQEPQEKWSHLQNVKALVLKPTLLGHRLDALIELGQKMNKKLVFSSSFESAIGLLHIAHLQARFSARVAAGIDTYRFFQNNFLPMTIKNGRLSDQPLPLIDRSWLCEYVP